MNQKSHVNKLSLVWGLILILGIAISISTIDIISSEHDFKVQSNKLRSDFINNQKEIIKQEVLRVAEFISHEKSQSETLTKQTIKLRVYEAWSIAHNIYQQNKKKEDTNTIITMITDALRPIRFEKGKGYYFMTDLNGIELLFSDRPEIEGTNILSLQDTQGTFVIKDMIEIAKNNGEGFYHYYWTRPGTKQNNFKKISFIKYIEPLNCFIGTGLYIDDIEARIKERLLSTISRIRFGTEGYIFINNLNGNALIADGKMLLEKKKLWEIFNANPDKTKQLFAKELRAANTPGGDYIYYSHNKMNSPTTKSPKTSFILGIPDLQWLVGAGVYLDDVEAEIATTQKQLYQQNKNKLSLVTLLTLTIVIFFLFLLRKFNKSLSNDINTITSFFNNIITSDEPINRAQLRFYEFDTMAKEINTMFTDKILTQHHLYAEQIALLESEERFRNTMDSTLIGVYIIQDFTFKYINPAMTKMFGYTKEEMLDNLSPLDLVVTTEREHVRENLTGREFGELQRINDIKCVRSNGEIFDTLALGASTTHEGKPASVGTMIDITERKAAEDELKRSKNRATALLEAIPDMVFRMNSDGVYLDVKAESSELYVPSGNSIIGKTNEELLPADLAKRIKTYLKETIHSGKMHTFEYQLTKPGQEELQYETRMVKSGKNEVTSIVRNITKINKAAKERSVLEKQLNQAKRMESIGLMAGGVAHDLNNILSGIVSYPDMILNKIPLDSDIRAQIEAIRDSGMRAAAVVDDLLTVARGVASTRESHQLNTLVLEYLKSPECSKLKVLYPEVIISHQLCHAGSAISCSEVHIRKCIMNLVTNAVEAITRSGRVIVTTNLQSIDKQSGLEKSLSAGQYIVLSINDNGSGISKQDIEHVFDPFYSKKSMARSGTGLGLTVVWNTVKDHNGKIFVESNSKGTNFDLYIPLQHPTETVVSQQKDIITDKPTTGKGEHILVVDDEPLLQNVAYEILTFLGYKVDSVSSGEEAVDFVKSKKVDLLLIDMQMEPGINGYETFKIINALYPGQKAIIASGYSDNKDITSSLELGAQAFIKKPYTLEQLGNAVLDSLQS